MTFTTFQEDLNKTALDHDLPPVFNDDESINQFWIKTIRLYGLYQMSKYFEEICNLKKYCVDSGIEKKFGELK